MLTTEKTEHVQSVQTQDSLSRSKIATNIRAVNDLKECLQRSRDTINHDLSSKRDANVMLLLKEREQLFKLEDEIDAYSQKVLSQTKTSTAGLSDKEKQEIKGLYQSGLYTQGQIADQYGITQPAVSQLVKN